VTRAAFKAVRLRVKPRGGGFDSHPLPPLAGSLRRTFARTDPPCLKALQFPSAFGIDGSPAGTATEAAGVFVNGRDEVTIRGGQINGFAIGISVEGPTRTSSSGILIENNTVSNSTKAGIQVWAEHVTIRGNIVKNTGGSTSSVLYGTSLGAFSTGISTTDRQFQTHLGYAGPIEILDNSVTNTFPPAAGGFTVAIQGASSEGALVARTK
jgi:parallel beta-helix repeat protein